MTHGLPVRACALGPRHLWRGRAESGGGLSLRVWAEATHKHELSNTYMPRAYK